jgi:hypothetical protein
MNTLFLLSILTEYKTFIPEHTGRTLGTHLFNTYKILKNLKAKEYVCIAGGLHSIYGTNVFKNGVTKDRDSIKKLVGDEIENLIYLFSTINRPAGLDSGELFDYESFEKINVDSQTLEDLKLMEVANLLEQGHGLDMYPNLQTYYNNIKENLK